MRAEKGTHQHDPCGCPSKPFPDQGHLEKSLDSLRAGSFTQSRNLSSFFSNLSRNDSSKNPRRNADRECSTVHHPGVSKAVSKPLSNVMVLECLLPHPSVCLILDIFIHCMAFLHPWFIIILFPFDFPFFSFSFLFFSFLFFSFLFFFLESHRVRVVSEAKERVPVEISKMASSSSVSDDPRPPHDLTEISRRIEDSLTPSESELFRLLRSTSIHRCPHVVSRVAGGWVRDRILGVSSNDIDIALNTSRLLFSQPIHQ